MKVYILCLHTYIYWHIALMQNSGYYCTIFYILGGQPCHYRVNKCVARFVSGSWTFCLQLEWLDVYFYFNQQNAVATILFMYSDCTMYVGIRTPLHRFAFVVFFRVLLYCSQLIYGARCCCDFICRPMTWRVFCAFARKRT